MSVAMSATGGGGYMSLQPQMPQMRAPNYNAQSTNRSSVFKIPSASAPSDGTEDIRGGFSGDECLTLDVDDALSSAIWHEIDCRCTVLSAIELAVDSSELHEKIDDSKITKCIRQAIRKLEQTSIPDATESKKKAVSSKGSSGKKKKKETNFSCGKGGITLVLASSLDQSELRSAAASVTSAGFNVKNIFGRGIATITGVMARSAKYSEPPNDLLQSLSASRKLNVTTVEDSVIFYVNFKSGKSAGDDEDVIHLDTALVSLEYGRGIMSNIGFQRLNTLAVANRICRETSRDGLDKSLKEAYEQLLVIAAAPQVKLSAIVFGGSDAPPEEERKREAAVARLGKYPIYRALKDDAVIGGCILSAGELDSSKEYLQQGDGSWVLVYQLPVADGHLSRQIGLLEQHSPDSSAAVNAKPQIIFSSRRLWKREIGPIKPGSIAMEEGVAEITREYSCIPPSILSRLMKLMSSSGKGSEEKIIYEKSGSWPRLTLVERSFLEGSIESPWVKLGEDLTPLGLTSKASAPLLPGEARVLDPVDSCVVTISVSPHTGMVTASERKGKLLKHRRDDFWFWVHVCLCILVVALLLSSPFLFGYWKERSVKAEHKKWLRDFYLKHAPEKLLDSKYVERTVRKYEGRMFLLWRGLKRTYGVDFPAPSSILEGVGSDL